jgi:hypothetical protein
LKEAILAGLTPRRDALWVIGCESITQDGVEEFRQSVVPRRPP